MNMKARMLGEPLLNVRMLVGSVVVADQMQCLVLRVLPIDLTQERKPLDMSMTLLATRDDGTVKRIHCREQGRGSVALVVMRHGGGPAGLHRQAGLSTIKCLHLAFLVTAQHQRVLGRGHVQADNIFGFLDELRITLHFEALDPVRLQAIRLPNALNSDVAHTGDRR